MSLIYAQLHTLHSQHCQDLVTGYSTHHESGLFRKVQRLKVRYGVVWGTLLDLLLLGHHFGLGRLFEAQHDGARLLSRLERLDPVGAGQRLCSRIGFVE